MVGKVLYVGGLSVLVVVIGVMTLQYRLPIGPMVLALTLIPLGGMVLAQRSLLGAVPDLVFGAIDTGLLAIPALLGGVFFGVAGAVGGGVIGDAVTDAIAGFFEGGIAEWLRNKGIEESREPVTTALGKMAGCLLGSGLVLCAALLSGVGLEL